MICVFFALVSAGLATTLEIVSTSEENFLRSIDPVLVMVSQTSVPSTELRTRGKESRKHGIQALWRDVVVVVFVVDLVQEGKSPQPVSI